MTHGPAGVWAQVQSGLAAALQIRRSAAYSDDVVDLELMADTTADHDAQTAAHSGRKWSAHSGRTGAGASKEPFPPRAPSGIVNP